MQKLIIFILRIRDLYNFLNFIPKYIVFAGNSIVLKSIDNGTTCFQKMVDRYYWNVDNLINRLSKSPKFQINFFYKIV